MTNLVKQKILENLNKKLKIVLLNDFIYHGFVTNPEDVDEKFISLKLDKANDIKIIRIDIIKEVIIYDAK